MAQTTSPIKRVARLINRNLDEVEGRIEWLEASLGYLAAFEERPLQEQLGWRCGLMGEDGAPPTVTLDLGREFPLDEVFLVPAQRQVGFDDHLFPRRFTLEAACVPDFSDARIIHRSAPSGQTALLGSPLLLPGDKKSARFIRLTVDEGVFRGLQGTAALSEIFVFSQQQPVSFGARVSTTQSVDIPGIWHGDFLVDGRTPLGLWEGGESTWTTSRGDCLEVAVGQQATEWIIDLGKTTQVDWLTLFPYALPELSGPGVIPPELAVEISTCPDFADARRIAGTGARPLPVDMTTPLILPATDSEGRYLRITSPRAWQVGSRHLQALGEIQVWSGGKNLAAGIPVSVRNAGLDHSIHDLTDGLGSNLILPIHSWLSQLVERQKVESKLLDLRDRSSKMAAETELNTTWGGALALAITFLVPAAVIERRRLVSRTQLDRLRKRIASDLHDDIGSNLGSISIIARSARRDLERRLGPGEISDDLGEVEVIARESSLAMRDIVWLLERRQDTIGDLVQRMRDSAARLLRDAEYSLICRSSKTAAKLTLDAKRHLFLFYKEALHNIVKHSRANQVVIRLYDSRDCLVLEITDNGVGLPAGTDPLLALKKISDRARVLEGNLQVESTPGTGTTLRLSVKRTNLMTPKRLSHE